VHGKNLVLQETCKARVVAYGNNLVGADGLLSLVLERICFGAGRFSSLRRFF
jgi:hypothetical protein